MPYKDSEKQRQAVNKAQKKYRQTHRMVLKEKAKGYRVIDNNRLNYLEKENQRLTECLNKALNL
jgi:biotin operon repressor